MERGTIRSFDRSSGDGTISRSGNSDVRFNASRIIGKDKGGFKPGDSVWFEVENIQSNHVAINIRKCM